MSRGDPIFAKTYSMCALSLANKRFSQAEKGAIVAEDFIITGWIDLVAPTPTQQAFLDSLAVSDLPHTHFFALYSVLTDRLVALDCARLTGECRVETKATKSQLRRDRIAACHEFESRIADYRPAIKKETQFNRQVRISTQIKQLEGQLAEISKKL